MTIDNDVLSFKNQLEKRKEVVNFENQKIKKSYNELLKKKPSLEKEIRAAFLKEVDSLNAEHSLVKNSHKFGGLTGVGSFRALITQRTRMQQLVGKAKCHEWALNDKKKAYRFLDLMNVRRPESSSKAYKLDELDFTPPVAVKPSAGVASRGVYLVYDFNDIWDIKKSRKISSIAEMKKNMKLSIDKKEVLNDSWLIEELILGDTDKKLPSSDFKFLCFYGKVGLVREISRVPEVLDCWWDREGHRVDTGQQLNKEKTLDGKGIQPHHLALVEKISSEIPAPFMRIDFLSSNNELIFGEFTPRPGSYDQFNETFDNHLGDMYLEAEARLADDLLSGKDFQLYKKYTSV